MEFKMKKSFGKNLTSAFAIAVVLSVTGCSLVPDYLRPSVETPETWKREDAAQKNNQDQVTQLWWTRFESAELNGMMDQALAQNNDIQAAIARVEQARANVKIQSASLFPTLGLSGSVSRNIVSSGGSSGTGTGSTLGSGTVGGGATVGTTSGISGSGRQATVYRAGADLSYEADLFGKNRATAESAERTLQASIYDQEAIRLMSLAEVARAYFTVLGLRERVGFAEKNLKNSSEVLRITNARFKAGASSALEVSQQQTSLSNTQSALASFKQQAEQAENNLALLLGTNAQKVNVTRDNMNDIKLPMIASVQPSELLRRRPDVNAAEASLLAANADIGAARALYYPSINLVGSPGIIATSLGGGSTESFGLLGSVAQPIFSGGAIEGQVELSEARKKELVENYKKTVLNSFKEVDDALSSTRGSGDQLAALKEGVAAANKAYDLSKKLYTAGATDFQTLLDSERALLQTEDNYAIARLANLSAAVDFYRALGGGWKLEQEQTPITISADGVAGATVDAKPDAANRNDISTDTVKSN